MIFDIRQQRLPASSMDEDQSDKDETNQYTGAHSTSFLGHIDIPSPIFVQIVGVMRLAASMTPQRQFHKHINAVNRINAALTQVEDQLMHYDNAISLATKGTETSPGGADKRELTDKQNVLAAHRELLEAAQDAGLQ